MSDIHEGQTHTAFQLVPKLQLGNAVWEALASRNIESWSLGASVKRDAGASLLHSHAGAWERY